jgi:hypothetical protein
MQSGKGTWETKMSTWLKSNLRNNLGALALIGSLLGMLVLTVWWGVWVWNAEGGPAIEGHVAVAMWLGIIFSLVVGCGLMALIFYSSRQGYDDRAYRANDRQ